MATFLSEDQIQKSIELNNAGYQLLKAGRVQDGLSTLSESCELGLPQALASLIWIKMIINDLEGAIQDYKKYSSTMKIWYESVIQLIGEESTDYHFTNQLLNVHTNYATALYLTGVDSEIVLNVCKEAESKGWVEAQALSFIVRGESLNQSFTRKKLLDLIDTYKAVQSDFKFYSESAPETVLPTPHKSFNKYAHDVQFELEKIPVFQLEEQMDGNFQYGDRMSLGQMAEIFVEFLDSQSEGYEEFYRENGLTLRLALALTNDMVKITPAGFDAFEKAWFDLCDEYGVDPEALYDSLEDL